MLFWRNFDLGGILAIWIGSSLSPIYYAFMCEQSWFWGQVYLFIIYFTIFAATAVCFILGPSQYPITVSVCYIIAGYSAIPAFVHAAYYMEEG